MESGIYVITNKKNGKQYIGQSIRIHRRWAEHTFESNLHKTTVLCRAFRKYGIDSFDFKVLEYCEFDLLDEREIHYIKELQPAYNMCEGGVGSKGHVVPDKTREILRQYGKSQWERLSNKERKERIKNNLKGPKKGHVVLPSTREKLRKAAKAQYLRNGPSEKQKIASSISTKKAHKEGRIEHYKREIFCFDAISQTYFGQFESIKQAGEFTKTNTASIVNACKGKRKKAGGLFWFYASSVETIPQGSRVDLRTTRSTGQPLQKVDDIVQSSSIIKVRELDKGMIDLARRSGNIESIFAETVYENDVFEFEYGLNPNLIHKPNLQERGKSIAWYAVAKFKDGGYQMKVMGKGDIEKARSRSMTGKSQYSPWATDYDAMAKKTVIRDMFKYLPVSNEIMRYSEKDAVIKKDISEDEGEIYIDIEPQQTTQITVSDVPEQPTIEMPAALMDLHRDFPEELRIALKQLNIETITDEHVEPITKRVNMILDEQQAAEIMPE